MSKLFTIAGTSTLNGKNTFRFATGKLSVRVAKLKRPATRMWLCRSCPRP